MTASSTLQHIRCCWSPANRALLGKYTTALNTLWEIYIGLIKNIVVKCCCVWHHCYISVGDDLPTTALSRFWLAHCIGHLKQKNNVWSWPVVLCTCFYKQRVGKGTKPRKSKLLDHILSQVRKPLFFQGKLKGNCEVLSEFAVLQRFS